MKQPARIVILGGGFAGAYSAQALERSLKPSEAEITLINRNNYFLFSPLLIEAGTGSLEPRHAVVPIRSFVQSTNFRMALAVNVDVQEQAIECHYKDGRIERLTYDHLVLALGSVSRLPDVPGLEEFGFTIQNLDDAVALRDRAIEMLELANTVGSQRVPEGLLRFVVVGANYTGVEVAGELEYLLRRATKIYPNLDSFDYRVTLVELANRILPALDEDLAEYARHQLEHRGIAIHLEDTVSEIGRDKVLLRSGKTLMSQTVIWAAGVAPNPLISRIGLPTDERGYILCERDLRVKGSENVWGIGDCAVNLDDKGSPYPPTAQLAILQGRFLAKNLTSVLRGGRAGFCNVASKGTLAALGCRTGVAKVFGFKLSGFLAWWLWRTVYLIRMPSWSRRIRVALDWTLELLFPRDFVQLDLRRRRRSQNSDAG